MINFIGIGAQKSGTSWVYSCLYEHPEICAPIKEIHFFSRDRFSNGKAWYEDHFKKCNNGKKVGEYSTSYLYSHVAAERIRALYPDVQLLVILRNPITRAYSQYGNAIKAGEIPKTTSFEAYYKEEQSVLNQGLYAEQIERYLKQFDRAQILLLIYEDSKKDPRTFIQNIYNFLGVRTDFIPSMLEDTINISRVPTFIWPEKVMHIISEYLRKHGLDTFVHTIRKSGLPGLVRSLNTCMKKKEREEYNPQELIQFFREDVQKLSTLLGRDLHTEWNI